MGGREKECLERSWVRNKGNLREADDGGKVGLHPCPFFCMDVALAAADRGCSASRQNETASTGLMTFHGLHSLFLKVTHCFHGSTCSADRKEEYFLTKTGHSEGTFSYAPGKHLREGLLTNSLCIQSLRGQSLQGRFLSCKHSCSDHAVGFGLSQKLLGCLVPSCGCSSCSGQGQQFGKGIEVSNTHQSKSVLPVGFTSCVPSFLTGWSHSELRTCSSSEVVCAPGEQMTPSDPNTAAAGALGALLMLPTLLVVPNTDSCIYLCPHPRIRT